VPFNYFIYFYILIVELLCISVKRAFYTSPSLIIQNRLNRNHYQQFTLDFPISLKYLPSLLYHSKRTNQRIFDLIITIEPLSSTSSHQQPSSQPNNNELIPHRLPLTIVSLQSVNQDISVESASNCLPAKNRDKEVNNPKEEKEEEQIKMNQSNHNKIISTSITPLEIQSSSSSSSKLPLKGSASNSPSSFQQLLRPSLNGPYMRVLPSMEDDDQQLRTTNSFEEGENKNHHQYNTVSTEQDDFQEELSLYQQTKQRQSHQLPPPLQQQPSSSQEHPTLVERQFYQFRVATNSINQYREYCQAYQLESQNQYSLSEPYQTSLSFSSASAVGSHTQDKLPRQKSHSHSSTTIRKHAAKYVSGKHLTLFQQSLPSIGEISNNDDTPDNHLPHYEQTQNSDLDELEIKADAKETRAQNQKTMVTMEVEDLENQEREDDEDEQQNIIQIIDEHDKTDDTQLDIDFKIDTHPPMMVAKRETESQGFHPLSTSANTSRRKDRSISQKASPTKSLLGASKKHQQQHQRQQRVSKPLIIPNIATLIPLISFQLVDHIVRLKINDLSNNSTAYYSVQEVYGFSSSSNTMISLNASTSNIAHPTSSSPGTENNITGKDELTDSNDADCCVICLTETASTILFPCRHMQTCLECSKRLISNHKLCPICRTAVMALFHVQSANHE
jgi:hypothetical protein